MFDVSLAASQPASQCGVLIRTMSFVYERNDSAGAAGRATIAGYKYLVPNWGYGIH